MIVKYCAHLVRLKILKHCVVGWRLLLYKLLTGWLVVCLLLVWLVINDTARCADLY